MTGRGGQRSGGSGSRGGKRRPPAPESVISESTFVSPKGRVYRILRTDQTDPYDPPGAAPNGSRVNRPTGRSTDDADEDDAERGGASQGGSTGGGGGGQV